MKITAVVKFQEYVKKDLSILPLFWVKHVLCDSYDFSSTYLQFFPLHDEIF